MNKNHAKTTLLAAMVLAIVSGCATKHTDDVVVYGTVVKSEKAEMICKTDGEKNIEMQAVTGGVISNGSNVEYGRNIEFNTGTEVGRGAYKDMVGDKADAYYACESKGYLTTITYKHHISGLQEHRGIMTNRQLKLGSVVEFRDTQGK